MDTAALRKSLEEEADVIIIGAGVAGASAAYHLTNTVPDIKVVILEAGGVGQGRSGLAKSSDGHRSHLGEEAIYHPHHSGTAVFPAQSRTIKMIVTLFPATCHEFIRHHGPKGAATYLRLAVEGVEMEKTLAKKLTSSPSILVEKGSLYVCEHGQEGELLEEYETLLRLGARVEWWNHAKVEATHGSHTAPGYTAGIYFPYDAVIDSVSYASLLIDAAVATGNAVLYEHCPPVTQAKNTPQGVSLTLGGASTGYSTYHSRKAQVIVATGGFYYDEVLAGILRPCWSYLVGLSTSKTPQEASLSSPSSYPISTTPNFFTYGFTHDWCVTNDGYIRVSGEDHFSALKPPRSEQRCRNLAEWAYRKYPHWLPRDALETYETRYGVYSETPDALPLVGKAYGTRQQQQQGEGGEVDRIVYLCGCNAWGQAVLTYAASFVPALLGYRQLTPQEQEAADLLSIRRFVRHPHHDDAVASNGIMSRL